MTRGLALQQPPNWSTRGPLISHELVLPIINAIIY
jgi:hypothetical protein